MRATDFLLIGLAVAIICAGLPMLAPVAVFV